MATEYGLRCYDSTGNLTVTENDALTRVIYQTIAAKDESGSKKVYKDYYTTIVAFGQSLENGKFGHKMIKIGAGIDDGGYYETWQWSPTVTPDTPERPRAKSQILILGY